MTEISRVTRSKDEARETYNRLSRWYDLVAGGFEATWREAGIRMLSPTTGERILEIGPGPGRALVALARRVGQDGWVVGLDLSPGMLKRAATAVDRAGYAGWVDVVNGDGAHLPYPSGAFDAVFMSFTLELFDTPEIPVVLEECRRVLDRSGRIAVVALSSSAGSRQVRRVYEWFHLRLPKLVDCRPIPVQFLLEQAGFSPSAATTGVSIGLAIESVVAMVPAGLADPIVS